MIDVIMGGIHTHKPKYQLSCLSCLVFYLYCVSTDSKGLLGLDLSLKAPEHAAVGEDEHCVHTYSVLWQKLEQGNKLAQKDVRNYIA